MKNITEEVKRFKLLSSYNTKLTLTENSNVDIVDTDIDEANDTLKGAVSLFRDDKVAFTSSRLGAAFKDIETAIGLKGNPILNKLNKELKTADEIFDAVRLGELSAKEIGRVEKGLLKSRSTPTELLPNIVNDFLSSDKVVKELSNKTVNEVKAMLKKADYSESAIKQILKDGKAKGIFSDVKVAGTKTKTGKGATSTVKKYTTDQFEKLKKYLSGGKRSWKNLLLWAAGIGITGTVLWNMLSDSGQAPDDMPPNPPTEGEWMECVQKLIANKTGILGSSASGEISVTVTNSQYPKGIQFYSNGRVFDVATGKKGTYKCKGGQIQQTNEQLDINEQGNEISQQQMASYVDDAVDDLDGYVAVYNLNNLKSYLTALKGKTYKGKDAIQAFLEFYKEDEGGDDFIKDVQSVGVKTLGVDGIEAKKDVLNLLQSSSTTTTPSSSSLDGIEITWDAATGTGGGNKGGGKESIYIDCSDDEFPIKFGCRKSPKIKQVQICFGFEQKYQTGNFGPITQKKLQDEYGQIFKSLDEETYNDIINNKCGKTTEPGQDIQIDPSTGRFKDDIFGKYKYNSKDRLQKIGNSNAEKTRNNTSINEKDGETLYNELIDKGYFDSGKIGDNRIKYKGPDLSEGEFNTLTNYFKSNGYYNSKKKDKGSQYVEDKSYKYVWLKSN